MSYLLFTSYARANTKYPPDADLVEKFVADLSNAVEQSIDPPVQNVCFFDRSDIEAGANWPNELEEALRTSRVALPLYSPGYFASKWCGKEFQVFLDRASKVPAAVRKTRPIVPVHWITSTILPVCAQPIQYDHQSFPDEYRELGLRQLMKVSRYKDAYEDAIAALAKAIIAAVAKQELPPAGALDLTNVPSAWEQAIDSQSHKAGAIAKTCFVFVATDGWNWLPYPQTNEKIGAIAQQLSGQLGLQYEEIPCDGSLAQKLRDTYQNNVPTVMFGDPDSLATAQFVRLMKDYDTMYLLNCGALVPWKSEVFADQRLEALRQEVFPQKIASPPPNHEWRSIFSSDDLKTRTVETIEKIRLRLLQTILSANTGTLAVLKAESQNLVDAAAQSGIRLDTAPQIASVSPSGN